MGVMHIVFQNVLLIMGLGAIQMCSVEVCVQSCLQEVSEDNIRKELTVFLRNLSKIAPKRCCIYGRTPLLGQVRHKSSQISLCWRIVSSLGNEVFGKMPLKPSTKCPPPTMYIQCNLVDCFHFCCCELQSCAKILGGAYALN